MPRIITVYSFRRGTGRSNVVANMAAILAAKGERVAIVDSDIPAPAMHLLLGLDEDRINRTFNDYLLGRCDIQQAAYDITPSLVKMGGGINIPGRVFLVPGSTRAADIAGVLRGGYDPELLADGFCALTEALQLDGLFIDAYPGLNEETLVLLALSDTLAIILCPDQRAYQGTSVIVEVARKLEVLRMGLIVNQVPHSFDFAVVKAQIEEAYQCEVIGILPHTDEMAALASASLFVLRYPSHPLTAAFKAITTRLML